MTYSVLQTWSRAFYYLSLKRLLKIRSRQLWWGSSMTIAVQQLQADYSPSFCHVTYLVVYDGFEEADQMNCVVDKVSCVANNVCIIIIPTLVSLQIHLTIIKFCYKTNFTQWQAYVSVEEQWSFLFCCLFWLFFQIPTKCVILVFGYLYVRYQYLMYSSTV